MANKHPKQYVSDKTGDVQIILNKQRFFKNCSTLHKTKQKN